MNFAEICIKRPVFTLMMNVALVVLGLFSYQSLGLDLFPKMDFPAVRIYATLPGAGPEEMETQIAKPIEEAVNTLGGIDTISTKCVFSAAQIIVRFDLEKNIDVVAQEVRDRIARVTKNFPDGAEPPIVEKIDPDAAPVLTLVVSSKMSMRDLTTFAKKRLKEPLEAVEGVGAIQMVGGREREIHVVLDAAKMAAYNIGVEQVKAAMIGQNIEIPGGNVTRSRSEWVLRTLGRLDDPAKFNDVIVATQNNVPIRVKDLGKAIDTEAEPRTIARLDGRNAFSLVIQRQSGTNTLDVVDRLRKRLSELKPNLPKDMSIAEIRDQSAFIRTSLKVLNEHLVLGAIFASIVVLIFMWNIASTLITSLAIPVSLISTFFLMKLMGFTLNNMSMLGLTLAVGIVIDDAIVVLENIFRHMEELKSDAMTAAREATAEIYLAIMATSLSLAVIFVPVAFMQGIIGRLLNNYGLTVAFAILVSIFVAFTLTPMLCSRVFQYRFARGSGHSKSSVFYSALERIYGVFLRFSMRARWLIVLVSVACLLSIPIIGKRISGDFIPVDDTNEFNVYFRAPEGTSLDGTLEILQEIEDKIRKVRGVEHIFSTLGEGAGVNVNEAAIYVQIIDLAKRDYSQFQVMDEVRRIMRGYPTMRPAVQASGGSFASGRMSDTNFFIKGPDLDKINTMVKNIRAKMLQTDLFGNVDSSFIDPKPEVQVRLDRERAYRLGVRLEAVAGALRTLVGGEDDVTRFKEDDELYEVRVRLRPEDRDNAAVISALMLPTSSGGMVRLDAVASVTEGFGPTQIDRQDRQRSIMIQANMATGKGLGDGNDFIMAAAKQENIPAEYVYGFFGKAREMERTKTGFVKAFKMSAVFMYLILASQFESLIHPITIMLSLPLSIPFALLSLWLTGGSLNVYSALGVFMLFGIVKKNAILQIDYTNTLRERGVPRDQAILQANLARFRPILMTTITLVAGMIPMAMGTGPGAATRASMATVIIGGQTLCLLITLLLTPVAYSYFDDIMGFFRRIAPKLEK